MRARRFDLNLPVWYRAADEEQWHTGVTETVSASGALIRAEGPPETSRPITVVIDLPSVAGCLIGSGRLVRTVETEAPPAATFAIAVGRFHLRSKAVLHQVA